MTPQYRCVYPHGGTGSRLFTWGALLAVIRSRRHYGLILPERVERVY